MARVREAHPAESGLMTNTGENARAIERGRSEPGAAFLRACLGLSTDRTPVWLMRQAGRYMREYQAIRSKYSMLETINTPEIAAEVTLQPIEKFGFDAAIIFSDILPLLIGMGLNLEFVEGVGPRITNPVSGPADVERLHRSEAAESMGPTLEAIRLVSAELDARDVPLIGFAGAPFTLASYAIEGGGTKTYAKVKTLMRTDPDTWNELMNRLVEVTVEYLRAQVEAGASALQLFDSWAGSALGVQDYVQYVKPYNTRLFEGLSGAGVPLINFSTGTAAYIDQVVSCGGDVIGVDWRMPLDWFWSRIGPGKAIQGNLDPVALLGPWEELRKQAEDILNRAAGRPGHIFNLGHGILPQTPVDNVMRLVDYVRERTSKP
jgi:uroporphyrinogen decarboxylase